MEALRLMVLIAGCGALLLAVVFVSIRLMSALFARSSGYARLAATYPGDAAPGEPGVATEEAGRLLRGQTAQFGAVRYTRCVTVGITDAGLFLHVVSRALGRHPPILVPWDAITSTRPATIRTREAVELLVGIPRPASLRVLPGVYAQFRSRLAAASPLA